MLPWIHNKDDLILYKFLSCSRNYQKKFDENLKKQFANAQKLSNHDFNKFILLLWKDVYTNEYMNNLEKLNETYLPQKEDFYSHLNMGDITDADYMQIKRVCKDIKIKKLGAYHDLHVQSVTTFERGVLKYMSLILIFFLHQS